MADSCDHGKHVRVECVDTRTTGGSANTTRLRDEVLPVDVLPKQRIPQCRVHAIEQKHRLCQCRRHVVRADQRVVNLARRSIIVLHGVCNVVGALEHAQQCLGDALHDTPPSGRKQCGLLQQREQGRQPGLQPGEGGGGRLPQGEGDEGEGVGGQKDVDPGRLLWG